MATIQPVKNEKIVSISRFFGINECPDGDTNLKYGESPSMQNFKITDNGALQIRGGTLNIAGLLSSYNITTATTATTVATDFNFATSTFTAYPTISVSSGGILTLSGTPVTITSANAYNYSGYYWQNTTTGLIYKFDSCIFTSPLTGTHITGGSVNIDAARHAVCVLPTGFLLNSYDEIKVSNGHVVGTGNSKSTYVPTGNYYQYCIPSSDNVYIVTDISVTAYNETLYGYGVNFIGDDKYTWNFYAVTATTNSSDTAVRGLWSGNVGGTEYIIAACNGFLWSLTESSGVWTKTSIGAISTASHVYMFGFSTKLYILDGSNYYAWDGTTLSTVVGYRPLVVISSAPVGGGAALEQINKLNGLRRVQFSPTGTTAFHLTETDITSIDYVKNTATGFNYTLTADYTVDAPNGNVNFITATRTENFTGNGSTRTFTLSTNNANILNITIAGTASTTYTYNILAKVITFASAPANGAAIVVTETIVPITGTNTVEIGYTVSTNYRSQITVMKYSQTYNGSTDTRIFLYGDGTNNTYYSGIQYDTGLPSAEYFPDLNAISVDSANTPITSMIKHFDQMLIFKSDSTFMTSYGIITLADNLTTSAFYTIPMNREIGNIALGQVKLVKNNPLSLFGSSVYEWQLSSFSAKDERIAKKKSARVNATLASLDLTNAVCFDDEFHTEYYVFQNGTCAVYNYSLDVWYVYSGISPTCMITYNQELYFGTAEGHICRLSRDYMNDNGSNIVAYWESGSMSFGADYMQKYSSCLWVSIKPEDSGEINVTVQTDRQSDNQSAVIGSGFFNFVTLDFTKLSFNCNDKPKIQMKKIKVKKFVYYKLIFRSDSNNTTATITAADIDVRFIGKAR